MDRRRGLLTAHAITESSKLSGRHICNAGVERLGYSGFSRLVHVDVILVCMCLRFSSFMLSKSGLTRGGVEEHLDCQPLFSEMVDPRRLYRTCGLGVAP